MGRLRIAAVGRLRAFDDTFEVQDPLGLGITFVLARRDCREHLAWLEKRTLNDPIARAVNNRVFDSLLAIADAGDGEAAEKALDDSSKVAIFRRLVASGDVQAAELMRAGGRDQLDESIALVKAWSGPGIADAETGQPTECTPDNVRELLTSDAEISEGEHEGKTLGEVLLPWILEQSQQRTRLARRVAEEAGKASAPQSGS